MLPGQGATPPQAASPPTPQALQPAEWELPQDVHCSLRTASSSEAEAWTGPAHSGKKPAGLVTLNQAKANLRLPALVLCLSCPWEPGSFSSLSSWGWEELAASWGWGYTGVRLAPSHRGLSVSGDRTLPLQGLLQRQRCMMEGAGAWGLGTVLP